MKLTISLILKFIKNQVIWEEEKGKNVKERKKKVIAILKKIWRLYILAYERKALFQKKLVIVPFYVIFAT